MMIWYDNDMMRRYLPKVVWNDCGLEVYISICEPKNQAII